MVGSRDRPHEGAWGAQRTHKGRKGGGVLVTCLQAHAECMLEGRLDRGHGIADLLYEGVNIPNGMYN